MKSFKIIAVIVFSLWLSACAQTSATKTTSPPQEETRQSTPTGKPAYPESADTGQQEDRQKSGPGEASSAESAKTPKKESGSPASAGSISKETQDKSSRSPGASQTPARDSAESKLEEARENLRISEQTEKRIAADLEKLKKSGQASDEAVKDYENYLDSVRAMTAENRKIVSQMEAAYAEKRPGKTGSDVPASNEMERMTDPSIPEEQTVDEVAALDRELNASLAKFDDMLLREMEKIKAGSSGKLQELAEEAAEAAKRLREKGLDVDTAGAKSSTEAEEGQEGETESGRERESSASKPGTETASRDGSRKGGEGTGSTDQRRTDYEDDDIVARQLREAAENETDPELKEKLWKEYEEYKKSK
ncbi:MAG: hypothetical protein JSW26_24435 [Desulfobacterales bacterium]|nr:MAG: hypothetical protein JSW26_24435 [Desulfobacterales bacterium]